LNKHLPSRLYSRSSCLLSIICTTQPSFISSATSQAGVAAAAGEEARDDHFLETVSDHGGEIFTTKAIQGMAWKIL